MPEPTPSGDQERQLREWEQAEDEQNASLVEDERNAADAAAHDASGDQERAGQVEEAEIFKVSGTGHAGSRSMGCGWWVKLPDGRFLKERQVSNGPPHEAVAVPHSLAVPVKTKREAQDLLDRFNATEADNG